jgi:hypothetical protein
MENALFDAILEMQKHGNTNERACAVALEWGGIDGAHHKMWVIDQMLRILAGGKYESLIALYERSGEYEWDTGISP